MFEVDPMNELVSMKKVGAYYHSGFWQCMDSLRDKKNLEEIYKKKPLWLNFDQIKNSSK